MSEVHSLYTRVAGAGDRTFVFLPGLGATTRYWALRVEALERTHRLVLVDLLGFGESPKPWTRYSVDRHIAALRASLSAYAPFTLTGHSLGALLALAYAARYPDDVERLILMGMPYFGSQRAAYRYYRQRPVRGGWLFTNVVPNAATCMVTRRLLGRLLPYLLRDVPREVAEDLVKHTWRASTSSLWEVVYRYDAAADIARLSPTQRVLCVDGDQDVMAPLSAIEVLAAGRPNWKLHILHGVDHHPLLRATDACLTLIDTFARASSLK